MTEFVLFLMTFVFVFIIYQVFFVVPAKNRELIEIKYMQHVYKIDMKKIKYEQLLQICAIVSSIDISLAVSFMSIFKNFILELLCGIILIIILIMISYHCVYIFYKRKGMIEDGNK